MDNSPETKKAQTSAASAKATPASKPASTGKPVVTPSPTLSTAPAKAAPADSNYKTANIGQWKSKQEDYFAKQNQERKEKKAKQKATFKKALPFLITFGVLIVVGLGTWGIISLVNYLNRPTLEETASDPSIISGNSSEAIRSYQDYLQQVYNDALASAMAEEGANIDIDPVSDEAKKKANEALSAAVSNTANTEAGEKYRDAMRLSEMLVYYDTWQCDNILHLENQINPDNLNLQGQYHYYLSLQNCYQDRGDTERADNLWRTVTEIYGQVYEGDSGILREGVEE